MARIDHASLAERAKQKLGLVLADDLGALAISPRQVRGLVRDGVLASHGRGVFVHRAAPPSAHQRLLVATHLAGVGAVASHFTAAWLWGFDGLWPDCMELSVPSDRRPRVPGAVIHRMATCCRWT